MKFKYLFENDLITLQEVPLHIQELGDVFAQVSDILGNKTVYIVNHDGWNAFTLVNNVVKEYNPLIHEDDPKELLITVSKDFQKPLVKYIVS